MHFGLEWCRSARRGVDIELGSELRMTTQRLWAAVAGLVFGLAAFAGGPAGLVGNGISSAKAQSASSLVANVMGLLQANPVNQAKLNSAIAAAATAGGPGLIAALVVSASVGAPGKPPNNALAQTMATALVTAAKSNPAIQTAVGQGLGAAATTLSRSGNTALAAAVSTTASSSGTAAIIAGANNSNNVVVVQPSPSQSGPQCSGGSCN